MPVPATLDSTSPLDNSFGALFIGLVVSAVLHGLGLVQVWLYFRKYRNDPWYTRYAVIAVISFDAMHLILISIGVYHYLIKSFHDPVKLEFLTWSILLEALLPGTNGAIVQAFYTTRIWRLSNHNYLICGFISFLILCEAGSGVAWVIISLTLDTWHDLLRLSPLSMTINILSTTVDVLISISLCFMLHKSRTGFKRSDSMINKLMIFVVNTGLLTTTFAMTTLSCLAASPHSLIYVAFYFCLSRLYTNSFLATLNARTSITEQIADTELQPSTNFIPGTIGSLPTRGNTISIRIDTTREAEISRGDEKFDSLKGSDDDLTTRKSSTLSSKVNC